MIDIHSHIIFDVDDGPLTIDESLSLLEESYMQGVRTIVSTLLQNSNFNFMIDTVKELFDYVIVDTPPIGLVIDSAIISQKADANILVTEAGAIKRRFIQKAKEQMEQSGALFLGVILNKVEETLDSYGGYGSYGAYGNYGKPAKKKSRKRR